MEQTVLNNNKGFATIVALIMVAMLTLIGLAALSTSDDEISISGNQLQETRAFYAAEAGLEMAAAKLHYLSDSTGTMASVMPSGSGSINNCNFDFATHDMGPVELRVLDNGTLAGLNAQVKSYAMTAVGVNQTDGAIVSVSQTFERALVPLFQFAVFYGNDLEIAPGPDMSLLGRVHSNGNLYLQAGSSLQMDSYVTASGNIVHGRKGPGSVSNGDILIKDGSGNYVSMQESGGWLEATDAHWYDSSVARWNGRVQDSTHGQGKLELPLTNSDDPHKMIERGSGNTDSYEHEATLKFIDDQAYQLVGGVWSNVTGDMVARGIISTTTDKFYDGRELTWVDVTELDIDKLYSEGYGPDNGVIYFSDQTEDYPALRINNGSELGDALTIASENPVYTNGDFNSTNKKPASIMADAVTFLSNNWDDALSSGSKYSRVPDNTTVNASFLTGNTETTSSTYNGGFENLPRFLEHWTGKTFTWRGSMVNLWNSQQANGTWSGTYYSPPNRDWMYDTDLDNPANHPPATPMIRIFQRTGWKQEYVNYIGDAKEYEIQ